MEVATDGPGCSKKKAMVVFMSDFDMNCTRQPATGNREPTGEGRTYLAMALQAVSIAPKRVVNSVISGLSMATSVMKRFRVTPVVSQTSSKTGAFVLGSTGAELVAIPKDEAVRWAGPVSGEKPATGATTRERSCTIFMVVCFQLHLFPTYRPDKLANAKCYVHSIVSLVCGTTDFVVRQTPSSCHLMQENLRLSPTNLCMQ